MIDPQVDSKKYWCVAFNFLTSPVAIGLHFTVVVPYYEDMFQQSPARTGLFLAIGEALGFALVIVLTLDYVQTSTALKLFHKQAPACTLILLSAASAMQLSENVTIASLGLIFAQMFNALGHCSCNELIGTFAANDVKVSLN